MGCHKRYAPVGRDVPPQFPKPVAICCPRVLVTNPWEVDIAEMQCLDYHDDSPTGKKLLGMGVPSAHASPRPSRRPRRLARPRIPRGTRRADRIRGLDQVVFDTACHFGASPSAWPRGLRLIGAQMAAWASDCRALGNPFLLFFFFHFWCLLDFKTCAEIPCV